MVSKLMSRSAMSLSTQSAAELQAKAEELRRMADTATTADTKEALIRLATRLVQLAETRLVNSCAS